MADTPPAALLGGAWSCVVALDPPGFFGTTFRGQPKRFCGQTESWLSGRAVSFPDPLGLLVLQSGSAAPDWVSFSWVGIPLSWALSSPAWPFPSPTQLATKLGHLLHVWRLAQACWVGHVLNYDPRLHANYSYGRLQFPRSSRLTPSGALLILDDTHLHDTLLYLPGRRFGLSSLVSRIPSSLFLSMDSELLLSMENLQFTEEESGSVVMEPPGDEGESSLWLVGSVVTNKTVNGDSVCRIFRSV
ncbi:hypothetical protein V6N13_040427 [Hibiscus sabdariffa]